MILRTEEGWSLSEVKTFNPSKSSSSPSAIDLNVVSTFINRRWGGGQRWGEEGEREGGVVVKGE